MRWPKIFSRNIQQQNRAISVLDTIAIREADKIEAELKEELSKEILQMRIERAVFADLQLLIKALTRIRENLRFAAQYRGNVGPLHLQEAQTELAALESTAPPGLLVKIESLLPAAIKVDAQKGNVARKIHTELSNIHSKLLNESNRIKLEESL